MKKYLLPLLLLVGIATHAQNLEKALLWKISGNGLPSSSYLYGTIHATCNFTIDENTSKALKNTEQLYLELDIDDPSLQTSMIVMISMKNGVTMNQLANEKDLAVLDQFLKDNIGVGVGVVSNFKPFFVSAMLLPKLLDCEIKSVESELMYLMAEQNESVFGIETVAEQMAVFDAIPYQEQMNELVKTAKNNMVNDKKEFQEILALYASKDISGMLAASEASENMISSKFEKELLTNRNQTWIPRMQKIMLDKSTFFGVGAAHLAGENGVIQLLRKQGFKVEAVF